MTEAQKMKGIKVRSALLTKFWNDVYKLIGETWPASLNNQNGIITIISEDMKKQGVDILAKEIPISTIFVGKVGFGPYGLWAKSKSGVGMLNPECQTTLFTNATLYPAPECPISNYIPVQLIATVMPVEQLKTLIE